MNESARQRWVGAEAEEKHVGLRNSMCEDYKRGLKSTESKEEVVLNGFGAMSRSRTLQIHVGHGRIWTFILRLLGGCCRFQ